MIQFLINILSVVFTAFLVGFILVWIQRKFSKEPQYKMTCEFKTFILLTDDLVCNDRDAHKAKSQWKQLNSLGAEGWEIVGLGSKSFVGLEIFLQRTTIHTL